MCYKNEYQKRAHGEVEQIFRELLPEAGLHVREEQIRLCHEMLDALMKNEITLCDAGVGIGKTYAYLTACILMRKYSVLHSGYSGCDRRSVVVSTSSIALQKAIIEEYVPFLSDVRRSALAILYYLEYIHEKKKELTDVYQMPYVEQTNHFVEFLYWLKAGKHTRDKNHRSPNNGTCNAYLRDVFRFYLFIEEEYQQFGELKVLSYNYFVAVDAVGVKKSIRSKSFKGYLKEEEHKARAAKKDEIVEILKACTNIRDRLLMLLLAETGYRIGEILGIDYSKDIDYQNHIIRVYFREDNENGARAKNAEYRSAKISKDTFGFLNLYIAEYRKLLQHQTSLFVNISGDNIGKPMNVEAVYSMLKRMDKKNTFCSIPLRSCNRKECGNGTVSEQHGLEF